MRTKYTPGPWKVVPGRVGVTVHIDTVDDSEWITDIIDTDEGKENARLIAAAPELLEVLKSLVGILKEVIDDVGLNPAGGLYKTAVELIEKVEGQ